MKIIALLTYLFLSISLTGCIGVHSGVKPLDPPGHKLLPTPSVKSPNPTLTWEPFKMEGIEDIHYHLIVSRYEDSMSVIAYERQDIYETSHTIEGILEPHTRYYWRIRPIYRKDGRQFAGSWNGYSYLVFLPPVIGWLGGNTYSFDTP